MPCSHMLYPLQALNSQLSTEVSLRGTCAPLSEHSTSLADRQPFCCASQSVPELIVTQPTGDMIDGYGQDKNSHNLDILDLEPVDQVSNPTTPGYGSCR
jgi:hypothetical protein